MCSRETGLWEACARDAARIERTLAGIPVARTRVDAQAFLHGNCDIFALALHEAYGYPVEIAANPDWDEDCISPLDALAHAYCRDGTDYIDVRGRTSDREAFFLPFTEPEDTGFEQPSVNEIKDTSTCLLGTDVFGLWLADAEDLVRAHADWYGPPKECPPQGRSFLLRRTVRPEYRRRDPPRMDGPRTTEGTIGRAGRDART